MKLVSAKSPTAQPDAERETQKAGDRGAAAPDGRVANVRSLRRRRQKRLGIRLAIGVGLPVLITAVYCGLIASPQYESVSAFTVQSADGTASPSLEFLITAVPGNSASRDALLVQEFIQSRDMLRLLTQKHGFVKHYGAGSVDYFSRLDTTDSLEDRYEYYLDKVTVDYDSYSGMLTLKVRAFSSAKAKEIANAIVTASEDMVNRMLEQARNDRIALASRELTQAETRLTKARQQLARLQQETSELNPLGSAEALLGVRGTLETELATARAELSAMRATLQPNAPKLLEQQQKVNALAGQLKLQTDRMAGRTQGGLNTTIAEFEPAMAEKLFAEQTYEAALKALEVARLEANRQHRYVVTIASPSAPDYPTHPRVLITILTVLVVSLGILGVGSLLLASVREHANL